MSWSIYYFFHSFLALQWTKDRCQAIGNYRFWYSVISILGLLPILYFGLKLDNTSYFSVSVISIFIGILVTGYGLWIVKLAFAPFSMKEFLGMKSQKSQEGLFTSGIHSKVRHPIYSGTVLVFLGVWLLTPGLASLLSVVVLLVYLPLGIYLEEKRLIAQFGDEYLDYKRKVSCVFPNLLL